MIGNNWDKLLEEEYKKEYFQELMTFIKNEYKEKVIYPKQNEVFNAFRYTDYNDLKVVILGQDPYHGPNQAEGLSFSVSNEVLKPPSLKNIFKELEDDTIDLVRIIDIFNPSAKVVDLLTKIELPAGVDIKTKL